MGILEAALWMVVVVVALAVLGVALPGAVFLMWNKEKP